MLPEMEVTVPLTDVKLTLIRATLPVRAVRFAGDVSDVLGYCAVRLAEICDVESHTVEDGENGIEAGLNPAFGVLAIRHAGLTRRRADREGS